MAKVGVAMVSGGKKVQPPELKKYLDRRLCVKLNAGREVTGVLRGFDQFMNLVRVSE